MRKCVAGSRQTEPINTHARTLLAKALLEVSSLGRRSQRGRLARQPRSRVTSPMRGEIRRPEGRIECRRKRRREGVEDRSRPACVCARRKIPRGFGSNHGAFPEDVNYGCMDVPTVRARAVGPPNVS